MNIKDNIRSFLFEKEERAITRDDIVGPEFAGGDYEDDLRTDNPISVNDALTITAVWAAVTDISTSLAAADLRVVDSGGNEVDNIALDYFDGTLIQNSFALRETMALHLVAAGDAFLELAIQDRDMYNVTPGKITVRTEGRVKVYEREGEILDPFTILHIPGISYGGLTGMNPAYVFRRVFNLMIAAERFGYRFFRTGGFWGALEMDSNAQPSQESAAQLGNDLKDVQSGRKDFLALPLGTKLNMNNATPGGAGFVNARAMLVHDVARIFNMPGSRLDPSAGSTYNNRIIDNYRFVRGTLNPHANRIVAALNDKFLQGTGLSFKFNFDELLKGSLMEEAQLYQGLVSSGIVIENEAREALGFDELTFAQLSQEIQRVAIGNASNGT